MKLTVDKKYLILPLGYYATKKKLIFLQDGELVFDLDATIDIIEPDYFEYINMEPYRGCVLDIQCDPIDIPFEWTDHISDTGVYGEKHRPQIHFSAKRGWINDPNGLVLFEGVYHMFYQYNPAGYKWGNMHWGHAVSRDLLHWEEKDCALYPDKFGTMFSGSAIIDTENRTGLKENENDVILLYYTAAGGNSLLSANEKFTQCMAYSTDGGKSFQKYEKNPIISNIENENRDPKVIYCTEMQTYIMALYLNDNRYVLLSSENLIDWKNIQHLKLPGDSECPDFYPLPADGDPKKIRWVFSGASDYYQIGDIHNGAFRINHPTKRLHYGKNSYAAQTFSNTNDRRIRIAWNTMEIPNTYFNNSMCFPTEMQLKTINDDEYLCLYPIPEIQNLYVNTNHYTGINVSKENAFSTPLKGKTQDIHLQLSCDENSEFSISLLGMVITCKVTENLLQMQDSTIPLFFNKGGIQLRLIVDTLGVELFVDQGQAHMCVGYLCDYNINHLKIDVANGTVQLKDCMIAELESIWQNKK